MRNEKTMFGIIHINYLDPVNSCKLPNWKGSQSRDWPIVKRFYLFFFPYYMDGWQSIGDVVSVMAFLRTASQKRHFSPKHSATWKFQSILKSNCVKLHKIQRYTANTCMGLPVLAPAFPHYLYSFGLIIRKDLVARSVNWHTNISELYHFFPVRNIFTYSQLKKVYLFAKGIDLACLLFHSCTPVLVIT